MKTNQFKLIQMSFDGEYVHDSDHNTIEDAEEASAELGSKWFFYPFSIIVKGQTVKSTGGNLYDMQTQECILSKLLSGKRLQTVKKLFSKVSEMPEAKNLDCVQYEDLLISVI